VTPGIRTLLIANVSVFILQYVAYRLGDDSVLTIFGLKPAMVFSAHLRVWQLFTYMFLHSPDYLFHLLLNMLMLWMFGTQVEQAMGTRAFLRYYFLCGIGAGLTTCLVFRDSLTVGASGAIFGVMLAYAMLFPNRQILFWFIFPMRAPSFVLLCAAIELFALMGLQDGVAHSAHLGGMLFGYLYFKRAWRFREFLAELRWRLRRRRFRVLDRDDRRYPFH
jgi:membrane associated rhomboid family serine protease